MSFLAACGLVLSVLVADRDAASLSAGPIAPAVEAAAGEPADMPAAAIATEDFAALGTEAANADTAPAAADSMEKMAARAEEATPTDSMPVHPAASRESAAPPPAVPRYRLAAAAALAGVKEAYPDPREGLMRQQLAARADSKAAAVEEAGLALSPRTQREVQQRLRLAGYDPSGVDGVFGPATRAAIAAWQEKARMPPTGYVTESTLSRLVAETDEAYRAWRAAEAARRARNLAAVLPMPRPHLAAADGCVRLGSGKIAYGQNVRCDVMGLKQRLGAVSETLAQAITTLERSRFSTLGRTPGGA